ncbi:MAG TPA: transcriptional repressor LexA [bacterium]|nr:transcriptional repressor LexA [bacterium]
MKDSGKGKTPKLTLRQAETLEWIRSFVRLHGKPPTMREIGAQFGIASSSVFDLVKALERKGQLRRGEGASRTVELVGRANQNKPDVGLEVPIVGRIAAGRPIWAVENIEGTVTVDAALSRRYNRLFALNVTGDSMEGAGILDGDLVIVAQQEWADSGDIVVALIGDSATVKRLELGRKGAIRLVAANPKYDDIVIRDPDFRIQGKVIGVQRHIG